MMEEGIRKVTGQSGKVYMEDEKLGTVSRCPFNLGRAGVHIRVPKLIEKIGFEKIDELARSAFAKHEAARANTLKWSAVSMCPTGDDWDFPKLNWSRT